MHVIDDRLSYESFIASKQHCGTDSGFEPTFLPEFLFDFQRSLVEWSVRKGRAGLFEDCGLGKTIQELVWAENVVRHTNGRVLILTPIAVSQQFLSEGEKFGVECRRSMDGQVDGPGIYVAPYSRLHHFDRSQFVGVVGDESSCLKDETGKRTAAVTEFVRKLEYRLLGTATAAPNDWTELGTSSEVLGELGFQDMVSKFFHKETFKDFLGWGRTTYRMRAYAERDFWRWVCSWSRACRKPSDLGFDDGKFTLPPLITREHEVKPNATDPTRLFDVPATSLREQRQELRRSLAERCEKVAELVGTTGKPAVCWVHLNDEGDLIEKLVPGAVQVSGADSDEAKEEKLLAFAAGQIRVLVSKPSIAGYGLNWQHCAHQTYFPSHSFEQWYQGVRRSWRFGQTQPVHVDIVTTEGGHGVLKNLQTKAERCDQMFAELVRLMNDSLRVPKSRYGNQQEEIPGWLSSSKN